MMNTQQTSRKIQTTNHLGFSFPCHSMNTIARLVILLVALSLTVQQLTGTTWRAEADGPDMASVIALVQDGQALSALQAVAYEAAARGNWSVAPGDEIVYDRYMNRNVRGATQDVDEAFHCANAELTFDEQECLNNHHAAERQVRFGPSFFTTPQASGPALPRPAFDDLLSTFIEEVGHSWQEYLYETNGTGSGLRRRETTQAESERWAQGREYQIKMYILSLDGILLTLSDQQRETLTSQICGGYASPIDHEVPPYGAPAGWVNPEDWPTNNPTQAEFDAFCAS